MVNGPESAPGRAQSTEQIASAGADTEGGTGLGQQPPQDAQTHQPVPAQPTAGGPTAVGPTEGGPTGAGHGLDTGERQRAQLLED